MSAVFYRCLPDPPCPYCSGSSTVPSEQSFDWSFLDGVYCISLQTREDRASTAAREFHRVGLCQHVVFYRPVKHPTSPKKGVWESHRAVAQHARTHGQKTVLILEDDVVFHRWMSPRTVQAVHKALQRLPSGWRGFYLGHWPRRAHFVNMRTLLTSSFCTHAYIASSRLLKWLCENPYSKAVTRASGGGKGIDAVYATLPDMYAFFPMIALQSSSPSDHIVPSTSKRRLRDYVIKTKMRDYLLANLMRPSEMMVVAMSPLVSFLDSASRLRKRLSALLGE